MRPSIRAFRYLPLSGWLVSSLMIAGCATTVAHPAIPPVKAATRVPTDASQPVTTLDPLSGFIPVIREGRYTLVEPMPTSGQRDLMQQVVDVSIPTTLDATVGDGLRYVLLRSGYQLCNADDTTTLAALPLPAADLHLGPLTLHEALRTLAGPAWDLSVDPTTRSVCFHSHGLPVAPHASVSQAPIAGGADPDAAVDPFDPLQPWEPQP